MNKGIIIALAIILLMPILIFISPLLIPVLFLAGMLYVKAKFPVIKGAAGERYVSKELSKLGENYKVYHDLYVPNSKGGTTQIDHVVTSPYGIFVIETKHYRGWIFGQEHQRYWTQTIYKRKERLYNPIWQNYGHIQSLKKFLRSEEKECFYSIITFSHDSSLKFKEEFKSAKVIQISQLVGTVYRWTIEKISSNELKEINRALEELTIHDKKEKKQVMKKHIADIKNNQNEKVRKEKEQIKQNLCPKCGGNLSIKKGKYGIFYGCSNFPKCRYTKQVS